MKEFKSKPIKGIDSLDEYSLNNVARLENLEKFRNNPKYKEWAKKGGEVAGRKNVEDKLGIYGASKEQRTEWAKENGYIGGISCYEQKLGIHSDEVKEYIRKEYIEPKNGMFNLDFQREKGLRHAKEGKGVHGLSKEETIANAKKGGQASAAVVSKKVFQYSKDGEFIREHKSLSDAAEYVGKERRKSSQISCCCNGKQKTAFGFIWKYK